MDDSQYEDKRGNPRSRTYAKVQIEGAGTLGYLRDLSRGGCRLSLLGPIDAAVGGGLSVRVLPAPESGVPPFILAMEVRWAKESPPYFLVGGTTRAVGGEEAESALERLLSYYTE
jgi:hypothetical protein